MRVVIAGQGYVGLPLAVRAAEVGHSVVGYDVDERRIKRLAVGESYVEDIPDDVRNALTFHFVSKLDDVFELTLLPIHARELEEAGL